ncbi:heparan-alpha-glucosaminide N-acetyltransferase [Artemisia annua]|uniref:Heparan-alpha-glucosaminide N-acetyltransferase n=1 Tax=Artemisia annua TaxID=35608 RepID=A0A2U1N456_ARTAN|nr:heparan-alpha-glucosaminide N-acetyltransferase [Artemisia annua]
MKLQNRLNIAYDSSIPEHQGKSKLWLHIFLPKPLFKELMQPIKMMRFHLLSDYCSTEAKNQVGAAALVFSFCYTLVDIWNSSYLFMPFEWILKNAMLVYVMADVGMFAEFINGWYYDDPHNTLIYWDILDSETHFYWSLAFKKSRLPASREGWDNKMK